jgi:16S rRNA (adenine1518-N6/adenine1519-N6)-dimethyltransferase
MRAKKSLGQNFLKSVPALRKIVAAGEIKKSETILEIGPGRGALTAGLLEVAGRVIAVEKDRELFEFLQEKFKKEIEAHSLILVCEDILEFNASEAISKFFSGPRFSGSLPRPDHSKNLKSLRYKIIANIPYNITGAILKKFLASEHQPERMVLMVQYEVAKRILGHGKDGGKESILSISVKAYGEPSLILKVPARYFRPAPKVDSAVIAIKNISRRLFWEHKIDEEKFWEIVKKGFAHKRKKLSGNLKGVVSADQLAALSLKDKRAEDLSPDSWIALTKQGII